MSALAAKRPAPRSSGLPQRQPTPAPRPQLKLVTSAVQRRRALPFVLLCILLLAGAMLATVVLNTAMADRSYEISRLRSDLTASQQAEKAAWAQLEMLTSPTQLAASALELGMVPSTPVGYITLADSSITQHAGG